MSDDFVVAFCALIDKKEMKMTYSLPGLHMPLILRNPILIKLDITGSILGMFNDYKYSEKEIDLNPNDILFVFTDGLLEILNRDGKIFGNKGIINSIAPLGNKNVHEINRNILKNAMSFQGKKEFTDDVLIFSLNFLKKKTNKQLLEYNLFNSNKGFEYCFKTKGFCVDEALKLIMDSINELAEVDDKINGVLKIAIFELITNGIIHGNLNMTKYKKNPDFYDTELSKFY